MLCEVLLTSLWFIFVIFWLETISVWLFLSLTGSQEEAGLYQDRVLYHWGEGVFADDPGQMIYMLSSRWYSYTERDADLRQKKIKDSS